VVQSCDERELQLTITPEDAGEEVRSLSREERPQLILKEWEEGDLLELVHPILAKKHPGYDAINRLIKVRDDLYMAGFRLGLPHRCCWPFSAG